MKPRLGFGGQSERALGVPREEEARERQDVLAARAQRLDLRSG